MVIYLSIIDNVTGGSGRFMDYLNKKRKSVTKINNTDGTCQQCVVLGKKWADYKAFPDKNSADANIQNNEFRSLTKRTAE